MDKELRKISIEVYGLLSSLDCYTIRALIKKNVNCMVKATVRTHEKKLKEVTQNVVLPFTPTETVLNLSAWLSDDELEIFKDGLKHSIETFTYKQNWCVNHVWFYPSINKQKFKAWERHRGSESKDVLSGQQLC